MKKHLRICYGSDDRFEFIKNTVLVSIDYFDTVRIINTGELEFESKLKSITNNPKLKITNLSPFYGDLELVKGNYIKDIEIGDWFLWLDADERPSQILLDNIDLLIEECEIKKYTKVRFPWLQHETENPQYVKHAYDHMMKTFPKTKEEFYSNSNGIYAKDVLLKKTDNLSPNSNFGGHGSYSPESTINDTTYKLYHINHYKSCIAKEQSLVYSTWFLPFINVATHEQKKFINENECYKAIVKFRIENDVVLQNDLIKKLRENDLDFKNKLKSLLTSDLFKNAKDWYSYYYRWALNFDCGIETPHLYCGEKCCKYKETQL